MNRVRDDEWASRQVDQIERDRQEFLLLLLSVLPIQLIYPVLSGGPADKPLMVFFFSLILIVGVWILRGSRRRFLMAAILTLVSLELLWISLWPAAASLLPLGEFCLLLFLIILAGRSVQTFIRTSLPVSDLLIAVISVLFLCSTALGVGLYLIRGLYPSSLNGVLLTSDLPGAMAIGLSLLTLQGSGFISSVPIPPFLRVVSSLGMISGVILMIVFIGKITSTLMNRTKESE